MNKALTKVQGIVIALIVVIAIAAGTYLLPQLLKPTATPTTTPITPPTTTTPTTTPGWTTTPPTTTPITTPPTTPPTTILPPGMALANIGGVDIRVPEELKEFIDKCRVGEAGTVTIYLGTAMMSFEASIIEGLINKFNREYPCIKVEYTNYAGQDQLKAAVDASNIVRRVGTGPDIFTWAHDWTGMYADKGYIVALDDILPRETIEDIAGNYMSSAVSAATYKLKIYGLPWAAEAIALVINKDLVPNPPRTISEMLTIMSSFHNPSEDKYGLAYQIDAYHVYPWVSLFNGYYFDDYTFSVGVNTTETKSGIEFFVRNILPYLDYRDLGHENQLTIFTDGRAPMIITGPWNIPRIKSALGEEKITVIPIPKLNDTHVPKPFSGIKLFWMTQLSLLGEQPERKYANLLFITWFTLSDEALMTLVSQAGFIPVKTALLTKITNYPIVHGFAQAVFNSVPMPKDKRMSAVWQIGDYLSAIITEYTNARVQGKSVDEAVSIAVESISPKLNEAYSIIVDTIRRTYGG